jgi:hypothetical protein
MMFVSALDDTNAEDVTRSSRFTGFSEKMQEKLRRALQD